MKAGKRNLALEGIERQGLVGDACQSHGRQRRDVGCVRVARIAKSRIVIFDHKIARLDFGHEIAHPGEDIVESRRAEPRRRARPLVGAGRIRAGDSDKGIGRYG